MIGIAGEAFDGLDRAPVAADRQYQAGARRLAVDQDGAGAAHPMLAAQMRPGQVAPLAQEIGERQPRRHVVGECHVVDPEPHRSHAVASCAARIAATVSRSR